MNGRDGRSLTGLYRHWLPLVLLTLILSGCGQGNEAEKPVFHVSIRSNRVEAQTQATNLYTANPGSPPQLAPTPTPAVQLLPAATPAAPTAAPRLPAPTAPTIYRRPDRIVIPAIEVDAPVEPVHAQPDQVGNQWFQYWNTAAHAAGYHEGSALLGQPGNTVISGHNNIDGAIFRSLHLLKPGAEISLYADGYRYTYIVEDQFVVHESGVSIEQRLQNATWIGTTIDERITLVSCWPPDGNSHRVIVVAKPVASD